MSAPAGVLVRTDGCTGSAAYRRRLGQHRRSRTSRRLVLAVPPLAPCNGRSAWLAGTGAQPPTRCGFCWPPTVLMRGAPATSSGLWLTGGLAERTCTRLPHPRTAPSRPLTVPRTSHTQPRRGPPACSGPAIHREAAESHTRIVAPQRGRAPPACEPQRVRYRAEVPSNKPTLGSPRRT
jgi:hypothetical protein